MSDQRQQLEDERLATTLAALDRCKAAGARAEDLDTLACELGVKPWWKPQQEKQQCRE